MSHQMCGKARLMTGVLLFLTVSCNAHGANPVALPMSPSATISIDTSHVEAIESPASRHHQISDAVAVPGSGVFAAGPLDSPKAWAFILTGGGTVGWKRESESYEHPFVVGIDTNGGYWVAGVAQTRDVAKEMMTNSNARDVLKKVQFEYIRRFGADGSMSERISISSMGKNHFLKCGVAVPGGYVLTGWAAVPASMLAVWPGQRPQLADRDELTKFDALNPWIEMIDETGHRRWERTFSEHNTGCCAKTLVCQTVVPDFMSVQTERLPGPSRFSQII